MNYRFKGSGSIKSPLESLKASKKLEISMHASRTHYGKWIS